MPPACSPATEGGADVAALREEGAAIRRNLEEMAADRALGLITRPQMLAATGRAGSGWMRSAPSWTCRAGERAGAAGGCGERGERMGGAGPVPQASGDQDPDDGHAALAGPWRATPIRPGHGHSHLAAAREGLGSAERCCGGGDRSDRSGVSSSMTGARMVETGDRYPCEHEPWRGRDRSHYFEPDDPGGLGRVPAPGVPDL